MRLHFNDDLPFSIMSTGLRTLYGTLAPPGGRVAAYVRSTGLQDGDDQRFSEMLVTTLNAGLARCRSGKGDIVFVLPGHTENITGADFMSSLVAGTYIIGVGTGTTRPTFTWTATTSTFLFDVANTVLANCILKMGDAANGGISVAAPITVSAAGCAIVGCQIRCDGDANDLATIPITTTAAADDFVFVGNHCIGATAAVSTTFMDLIGADRAIITDNVIQWATSAAGVGVIRFATTASLNIQMLRNKIVNRLATSTAVVTCMAGVTGFVDDNLFFALGDHADFEVIGDANGVWATDPGSVEFGAGNRAANLVATVPITLTPVSA